MTDKKDEIISKLSLRIIYLSLIVLLLLLWVLILAFGNTKAPEQDAQIIDYIGEPKEIIPQYNTDFIDGVKLFKQNCAVCHSLFDNAITGRQGLKNISSRAPNKDWLISYISNSDSIYRTGDPYATKLRHEYLKEERMPKFNDLTKEEISAIIGYLTDTQPIEILP